MTQQFDPQLHHRRSIRLPGYDYTSPGAYFVTLCVRDRECIFGRVAGGLMELNEWGRAAAESWLWLAEQYPYVELDEWVVMPNHMHGIIVIVNELRRGRSRTTPAQTAPKRKPLGRLIGAFKTVSTKQINVMRNTPGEPIWQRNYYEHIVRNERALDAIRSYIAANPRRWESDRDNPRNRQWPPSQTDDYIQDASAPQ